MKFLTKEWFHWGDYLSEDADVNPRAAEYSESYYRELYIQRLYEFIDPNEGPSPDDDDLISQPWERDRDLPVIQAWLEIHTAETSKEESGEPSTPTDGPAHVLEVDATEIPREVYVDEEAFEIATFKAQVRAFDEQLMVMVKRLQQSLPPSILDEVADIRILALEECTEEIKERLVALAEEQIHLAEQRLVDYHEYVDVSFEGKRPEIVRQLNLQDCHIYAAYWEEDQLTLEFNPLEQMYQPVFRIRFEGIEVLENEGSLDHAYVLQTEVYPSEGGIEFHALLQSSRLSEDDESLMYLTLRARAVELNSASIRVR